MSDEYGIELTAGGTVMLRVGDYILALPPAAALAMAAELRRAAEHGLKITSQGRS